MAVLLYTTPFLVAKLTSSNAILSGSGVHTMTAFNLALQEQRPLLLALLSLCTSALSFGDPCKYAD